jgi:hypothetical protein
MKFILLLLFLSLPIASLFANEEILSTTDNDDNNEIYNLVVNVDDSTQRLLGLFKDTYQNGTKIRRDNLNPLDLKKSDGMILEKRGSHNVLNLKSDNFDYDRGGNISIDTLYNGITGERKTYDLELAKDQNSWKLFKAHVPVSKFHVKVNRVIFAGTVGIKTIDMK